MTVTSTVTLVRTRAQAVDWPRVLLLALIIWPLVLFAAARYVLRAAGWVASHLWAAGMVGWDLAGPERPPGSPRSAPQARPVSGWQR
ncbi:hypothetical protein ACIA47_23580 [Micromonospora sp. NPDC051227]|uniref:hypothetical protein n=1 Tax=Micromonospora sp. NPDC051227 TaxID=3364285 RepID=UPI00378FAA38